MLRRKKRPFFVLFLLLLAGFLAVTQEAGNFDIGAGGESDAEANGVQDDFALGEELPEETPEAIPGWVRPARWFRSNSGGMALEEVPSRLVALRNDYALVIDFFGVDELPDYLKSFYDDRYFIEARVLYAKGEESRRQWIFRDREGITRLTAVLRPVEEETAEEKTAGDAETAAADDDAEAAAGDAAAGDNTEAVADGAADDAQVSAPSAFTGFIELYDENSLITADYRFSGEFGETRTGFLYRRGTLVRAEARRKTGGGETETWTPTHTDNFFYNRFSALRAVERVYHERQEAGAEEKDSVPAEPVRLAFPNRILDAAKSDEFISGRLAVSSEFFGDTVVKSGYRMLFNTDERGKIRSQTLVDDEGNTIWTIENTWAGDRIVASQRTEGDDVRLTEYEYNDSGDRIVERNVRNGVLERVVRAEGDGRETEELYINGDVALRAVWEKGRKISEQRVRNRR